MNATETQAAAVAATIQADPNSSLVGIDPLTIITLISTLINMLKNCFNPPAGESVQGALQAECQGNGGTYSNHKLAQTKRQAGRALRHHHIKPTAERKEELALRVLDQARDGDPAGVSACCSETLAVAGSWPQDTDDVDDTDDDLIDGSEGDE